MTRKSFSHGVVSGGGGGVKCKCLLQNMAVTKESGYL